MMDWFWHLLARLTALDPRKRAILRHRYFYHVTPFDNVRDILTNGLDPDRCLQPNIRGPYDSKYICLTTEAGIRTVFEHRDDGMGGLPELALLRVPSYALVNIRFDLDQTHGEIHAQIRGARVASANEIRSLLPRFHYLVFLDRISPQNISEVSIYPYLTEYQATRA